MPEEEGGGEESKEGGEAEEGKVKSELPPTVPKDELKSVSDSELCISAPCILTPPALLVFVV